MRRIETNLYLSKIKPERSDWEKRELTQPSTATSTGLHGGERGGGREEGEVLGRSQLLKLSPSPTHQEALLPGDSLREECELPR